jgi:hypothetical protein
MQVLMQAELASGAGIRAILRVLPQQVERLYYWYYLREIYMMYTTGMASEA